jgi:hypothetical protein
MALVKLPKRTEAVKNASEREPVWSLSTGGNSYGTAQPPLKAMCDVHARPDAVCCRTLKGDDERALLDPDVVRDIILGLSDGLTVCFPDLALELSRAHRADD